MAFGWWEKVKSQNISESKDLYQESWFLYIVLARRVTVSITNAMNTNGTGTSGVVGRARHRKAKQLKRMKRRAQLDSADHITAQAHTIERERGLGDIILQVILAVSDPECDAVVQWELN